jgi:hypothetical protein
MHARSTDRHLDIVTGRFDAPARNDLRDRRRAEGREW